MTTTRGERLLPLLTLVAALLARLLAATADAAETEEKCTPFLADRTTVREVAQNQAAFEGKCVAIDGVMYGWTLHDDVDGVYLQPTRRHDPSSNGARLGLDNVPVNTDHGYRPVSIVGRVQDCEAIREAVYSSAGPDEVVMVTGYCHYMNGAYLWINRLKPRRGDAFLRQMGAVAREGYGDLQPAPAEWVHRAPVEALADVFITALRAGDRGALSEMHFGRVDQPEEREVLDFLLTSPQSPFADFRVSAPFQREVFIHRPSKIDEAEELPDEPLRNTANDVFATMCFCREQDCTGRWPIAQLDADNLESRPYACTKVTSYTPRDSESVWYYETAMETSGLKEPKARR